MNIRPAPRVWLTREVVQERYNRNEEWLRSMVINGRIRGAYPTPGSSVRCAMYCEEDVVEVLSRLTELHLGVPSRREKEPDPRTLPKTASGVYRLVKRRMKQQGFDFEATEE